MLIFGVRSVENEKKTNVSLQKVNKELVEKNDAYMIGKVVLKEENKKQKEDILKLINEKEIHPE